MRVHPSDLVDYRTTHQMLGPCCLCPLVSNNQPDFVEAAIYMPSEGDHAGKYIANCARDLCGYQGQLTMSSLGYQTHLIFMLIFRSAAR